MREIERFFSEHHDLTRRYFLKLGVGGLLAAGLWGRAEAADSDSKKHAVRQARFATYLTPPDQFEDVSRGKPYRTLCPTKRKLRRVSRGIRGGSKSFPTRNIRSNCKRQ